MQSAPEITSEALAAKGHDARGRGEWLESVRHWALFNALYPARPEGCLFVGDGLWRMKHYAAADDILLRGIARFPDSEDLIFNYGWAAMEKRDWAEAERRFRAALERFPRSISGRFGLSLAQRELGRLEEAEATLLEDPLQETHAPSRRLLAALARSLGKFDVAITRLRALVAQQADDPQLHIELVNCLSDAGCAADAEEALEAAVRRFPGDQTLLREMAVMAETARDWPLALRRWESFKTAFDSLPDGYLGATRALMQLARLEDAEAVMTPAVRAFAGNADALTLFAEIATQARRWAEAGIRWQAAQKLDPARPEAFLGEVRALRGAGNGAEAEELLASLVDRFPQDLDVACQYAQAPERIPDWAKAIERWRAVLATFPWNERPRGELARCLVEAGQFAEAEATVAEALALLPGTPYLLNAQAEIATRQGDAELGEARWSALIDRAPEYWPGVIGYARHIFNTGDLQRGFDILDAAAPRFRSELSFNVSRALLVGDMRDWPRALPLLAELKGQAGEAPGVRSEINHLVAQAKLELELAAADKSDAPPPFVIPPELLGDEADDARDRAIAKALLMRFESLGYNCEFGVVQRRFGAEPLSLLRFTGTPARDLAAAFRARLAGVGEPEFTELRIEGGIYHTLDTRYFMFGHTFTLATAAPYDKFHAAQCKRLRFLREKLLRDFAAAEKIFVYASSALTDDVIDELFDAVRELGPSATLLCVRPADERHPAGSVSRRRDGLLVAGIRRLSLVDIAVDDWLQICAAAAEMAATP